MSLSQLPAEILSVICEVIHDSSIPTNLSSLDPLGSTVGAPAPAAQPSSYPPGYWSEHTSRTTLASLCRVSRSCYAAAKPFIWRHVEVRLPRSWLAFVEEVADEPELEVSSDAGSTDAPHATSRPRAECSLHDSILARLTGFELPHESIPPELLSPPGSREPSPVRLRATSPQRTRTPRTFLAFEEADSDLYVPLPEDPRPGRHVRHLDFNHFRTIGMRRSVEEGVRSRFVTAERLERVLKSMPRLTSFGATEYMDGALNKAVLMELLLRGTALESKNISTRGRGVTQDVQAGSSLTEDDIERLQESEGLEALDLCGCVSSVFVQGLEDLIREYFDDETAADGTVIPSLVTLPTMKRLGLRGITSVSSAALSRFVLACPSLTHLDLSGTRCSPELLDALSQSTSVRLTSIALGRCPRLTATSIVDFLVYGLPAETLTQLSLYGEGTFVSPLNENDLMIIVTQAPCFKSGRLEYLDLSSSQVTPQVLQAFAQQPALRSLGLSHIPTLPLGAVRDFILHKAKNTEILTLVQTSPELTVAFRELPLTLHSHLIRPLATPPFHFSLSATASAPKPPPTQLRVIELSMSNLYSLSAGADAWKIVKSKGGRGWYVHTASGWVDGELRRNLSENHPLRMELERLSAANGNVGSGVGWHARKMEVLSGCGLLGREDGLYGAVSFAYQG